MSELAEHYLETVRAALEAQKQRAEEALARLEPTQYHTTLDLEMNSAAVIVKHMAGNMRSRWRDFLTSDGEKADRYRDDEFVDTLETVEEIMQVWEAGWQTLFDALDTLTPDDLLETVTIRGRELTVLQAVERQLAHYANHVGQIVFLAKHLRSEDWQMLSVARGKSDEFNESMGYDPDKATS